MKADSELTYGVTFRFAAVRQAASLFYATFVRARSTRWRRGAQGTAWIPASSDAYRMEDDTMTMAACMSRAGLGALLLLVLALAGCAGSYPPAPADLDEADQLRYVIGPGDQINIVVWGNPEVSQSITVPPDGVITSPLVEDLPATGKTGTELARDIEAELSTYIKEPVVTVIVSGFVGPYDRQVRVLGAAANPQALQFREGMTVMDVMIAVGGLTEFAAGNNATILRMEDGERRQYSVRLEDLVQDGDVSANVDMRPGDVLIVPESFL